MCVITHDAAEIVEVFERSRIADVKIYGPNLSKWPSRAVDVEALLEVERSRVSNAQMKAPAIESDER